MSPLTCLILNEVTLDVSSASSFSISLLHADEAGRFHPVPVTDPSELE